jgi:hypothetical protein
MLLRLPIGNEREKKKEKKRNYESLVSRRWSCDGIIAAALAG